MSVLPFWYDDKGGSEWDRLQLDDGRRPPKGLGKVVLPGAWKVECTCERDIDTKKSKGMDGARLEDHGYEPARVTFTGQFVSNDDWQTMQKYLPKLHPRKKGGPRSQLQVQHPALAVMGVSDVYIKAIKAPTISEGVLELSIECIEYTPVPKKKVVEKKYQVPPPFHMTLESPAAAFYRNQTFQYGSNPNATRLSDAFSAPLKPGSLPGFTSATQGQAAGQFSQDETAPTHTEYDDAGHVRPPQMSFAPAAKFGAPEAPAPSLPAGQSGANFDVDGPALPRGQSGDNFAINGPALPRGSSGDAPEPRPDAGFARAFGLAPNPPPA